MSLSFKSPATFNILKDQFKWYYFFSRQTIFVTLDTQGASELMYDPGDHVGAFPTNNPAQVDLILSQLHNAPPKDQLIKVEILQEKPTPLGM